MIDGICYDKKQNEDDFVNSYYVKDVPVYKSCMSFVVNGNIHPLWHAHQKVGNYSKFRMITCERRLLPFCSFFSASYCMAYDTVVPCVILFAILYYMMYRRSTYSHGSDCLTIVGKHHLILSMPVLVCSRCII